MSLFGSRSGSRAARSPATPPSPPGFPWLGNLPALVRYGAVDYLSRQWKRLGDTFLLRVGDRRLVVLAHPDSVAHVLAKNAANYRSLADQIKADCFVGSGVTGENYVQVFKDVAAACPDCKLYGPDGVAEAAFTDPKEGGIPANVAARTKVTVATLSPEEFEKQGIQKASQFFKDYDAKYGTKQPDPYAIYGYETMSLALDSLKAVGDKANDKEAVRKQLLENTKGRDSVLGTYDIDENGDTTLTDYGLYTIDNGQLTFDKVIKAQGS